MIDTHLIDTATTDTLIDWYNDLLQQLRDAEIDEWRGFVSPLNDLSEELSRRGVSLADLR